MVFLNQYFLQHYLLGIFLDKSESSCGRLEIGLQDSMCRCFGQTGFFYMEVCRSKIVNVSCLEKHDSSNHIIGIITLTG